jgi:IS1 family transposase
MRRRGLGSGACDGSSQLVRRKDSWVPMLPSPIYSILVGTWSGLSTTAISGSVRSQSGAGQSLDCPSLYLIGRNELTCQNRKQHYLWRAVDQDGEVVDVYLQAKRDGAAAKRIFKRLLRSHGGEPRKIVTDKLRSYPVAHREVMPETVHSTKQYANNRAEQSHEATRVRERGMRKFKSKGQAQRFVTTHAAVQNLFNLGRHLVKAQHYRDLRVSAFAVWSSAVA